MTTSNQEYRKASILERFLRFWFGALPYCEDCKFCIKKPLDPSSQSKHSPLRCYCRLLYDDNEEKYLIQRTERRHMSCYRARMDTAPCKKTGKYFTPKE